MSSSSCSCAGGGEPAGDDDHDEFATAGDDDHDEIDAGDNDHDEFATAGDGHDEIAADDGSSCSCAGWSSTGSLTRFQRSPR